MIADDIYKELNEYVIGIRRELHQYPELSWMEERTNELICRELDILGLDYHRVEGTFGVICNLKGKDSSKTIAFRGDIDALPIQEETNLPFKSKIDNVMHACGHDSHCAIILGLAKLLKLRYYSSLPYNIRLIFQPAEEKGDGALALIKKDCLKDVNVIYGLHIDRHYDLGNLVCQVGAVNASVDDFKITLSGKGGHAARPHQTSDTVVASASLIMNLQTIISRFINPSEQCVLTVGSIHGGNAPNVIAKQVSLEGTIRTNSNTVREDIKKSMERMVITTGINYQVDAKIEFKIGPPSLINEANLVSKGLEAVEGLSSISYFKKIGIDVKSVGLKSANMGGEDFAEYLQVVKGAFFRLGAKTTDGFDFPAHSSKFDINEQSMLIGVLLFSKLAFINPSC